MIIQSHVRIIILGGGVTGSFLAWRLFALKPDIEFLLLEGTHQLGGGRFRFWHERDLPETFPLLPEMAWDGFSVRPDGLARDLTARCFGIRSSALHQRLLKEIPARRVRLGSVVKEILKDEITLTSGHRFKADVILDARGFDLSAPAHGYKKTYGMELRLSEPTGLLRPLICDGSEALRDGLRLYSVFPIHGASLHVQETRYSTNMEMNLRDMETELLSYVRRRGWKISSVERVEHSLQGIPQSFERPAPPVYPIGVRAGWYQPLTGEPIPWASRFAEKLAHIKGAFTVEELEQAVGAFDYWASDAAQFPRALNRRLLNQEGLKFLSKLFKNDPAVLNRFFAGESGWRDRARILFREGIGPGLQTLAHEL